MNRLGALVAKTVSREYRIGNPPPRVAELECGMINSIGLPTKGLRYFLDVQLPEYRRFTPPLIASVTSTDIDDFAAMAREVSVPGVAAIELNISCPTREPGGGKPPLAVMIEQAQEWLKSKREADIPGRVKALRAAILPDMVAEKVDDAERNRRWKQLADIYLAQQLALYPPDYFGAEPTPEKLLETVERFEEDLTDVARIHRPLHAAIEVGEAIEVPPGRDRGTGATPMMTEVREQLEKMLEGLRARRPQAHAR